MSGSGSGTPIPASPTFVVEDGTGKTDANSYLSVDDADTYHSNVTGSAVWAGAALTTKQNALIVATQYLDARYGSKWRGFRSGADQALAWPRSMAYDEDGYAHDDDALPQRLQDATAELALRVVLGDQLLAPVPSPGQVTAESVTIGPITESKEYAGGRPYGTVYPKVAALVRPLIDETDRLYRG